MSDIEFGARLTRREDARLTTGLGRYTDDTAPRDALYVAFVRCPHAFARVKDVDTSQAECLDGVVRVLTGADLRADGVRDYSMPTTVKGPMARSAIQTDRPLLVSDIVRSTGEPVAMILAVSQNIADDAAEAVMVDFEEMEAIVTLGQASAADAPLIWDDHPDNIAFHWQRGDTDAVIEALSSSHHVTHLNTHISRVSANPLEPRSAHARIGPDGRPALYASHQSPHQLRDVICDMFKLGKGDIHIVAGDVGGSFGMKTGLPREEALVFWATKYTGLSLRWTATRSESLLSDDHGRDVWVDAQLGLDKEGNFTALLVKYTCNIGAYFSSRSVSQTNNIGGIVGVYKTPCVSGEIVGLFTNTQPTAPYRGAGRPESIFVIERLIDIAAIETGFDRIGLRLKNLIAPEQMPYQTPFIFRYDCGEFRANMEKALELADFSGFDARRELSLKRGKLRGIGLANPIEVAAGPFGKNPTDFARIEIASNGSISLFSGAMSVGQGLETALSGIAANLLQVPIEDVTYHQGNTDELASGKGNGGSAALTLCGSAIQSAAVEIVREAMIIAARLLDVAVDEVVFEDGSFGARGTNKKFSLAEVAAATGDAGGPGPALSAKASFKMEQPTFPNGCHICELEIDQETGEVEVINYVSVEDVGRVLNPMLVDGQIQGGVAQGIGQALMEKISYSEDGQLMSGSFMDYAMPRATDMTPITSFNLEVPTALNPLGVKGVGEAGTVGSLAASMNAVCHALQPLGISDFQMPATPYNVWTAINGRRIEGVLS